MPIITLTTDFGTKDHFVGAVKGSIYGELDEVQLVDISHEITPFSVTRLIFSKMLIRISLPEPFISLEWIQRSALRTNRWPLKWTSSFLSVVTTVFCL